MRSKWFLPLFCLALGVVVFVASWLGGQLRAGVVSLAIMAGFGLVLLLLTGHSETLRGLTTNRDERFVQIDLKATALAGLALIIAVIVAWLVRSPKGTAAARMPGSPPSPAWLTCSPWRSSAGVAER